MDLFRLLKYDRVVKSLCEHSEVLLKFWHHKVGFSMLNQDVSILNYEIHFYIPS